MPLTKRNINRITNTFRYFSAIAICLFVLSCEKRETRETKYDNGQIKERYTVVEDKNGSFLWDGEYTHWFENGQVEAKGNFKYRNPGDTMQGTSGIPIGGRSGKWFFWFENGQKGEQSNYKEGKTTGLFIAWHENGQKIAQGIWKDGKPNGLMTNWNENGQKFEQGIYKDGKPNGLITKWYNNGNKKSAAQYKNGIADGIFSSWWENGQKQYEGPFKNGKMDGVSAVRNKVRQIQFGRKPAELETMREEIGDTCGVVEG